MRKKYQKDTLPNLFLPVEGPSSTLFMADYSEQKRKTNNS